MSLLPLIQVRLVSVHCPGLFIVNLIDLYFAPVVTLIFSLHPLSFCMPQIRTVSLNCICKCSTFIKSGATSLSVSDHSVFY